MKFRVTELVEKSPASVKRDTASCMGMQEAPGEFVVKVGEASRRARQRRAVG
jgi:hypothetical protein